MQLKTIYIRWYHFLKGAPKLYFAHYSCVQGSFITETEWVPIFERECLSCKANDFYYKRCFFLRQKVLVYDRDKKYRKRTNNKSRFSLIVEEIQGDDILRYQIFCIGRTGRTILSLNFKQFNQTLHSNSLCKIDITCCFL